MYIICKSKQSQSTLLELLSTSTLPTLKASGILRRLSPKPCASGNISSILNRALLLLQLFSMTKHLNIIIAENYVGCRHLLDYLNATLTTAAMQRLHRLALPSSQRLLHDCKSTPYLSSATWSNKSTSPTQHCDKTYLSLLSRLQRCGAGKRATNNVQCKTN